MHGWSSQEFAPPSPALVCRFRVDEDDAMGVGREGEEKHHQARHPELKLLEHEHLDSREREREGEGGSRQSTQTMPRK